MLYLIGNRYLLVGVISNLFFFFFAKGPGTSLDPYHLFTCYPESLLSANYLRNNLNSLKKKTKKTYTVYFMWSPTRFHFRPGAL